MNPNYEREICILKFKSGDEPTLKKVFELYGGQLFFFANNMIKDKLQSEDIIAESFCKLWRQRKTFNELSYIRSYLFVITKNACLDYLKHVKRKNSSHKEIRYLMDDSHDEVINRIIYGDIINLVFRELKNLPVRARQVLELYIHGFKPEEISVQLDMPLQNVRNNKSRAVELLRLSLLKKSLYKRDLFIGMAAPIILLGLFS